MAGVWIDTDMGSDDVFAIVATLAHRKVDAMSLVSGNTPLAQVALNTTRLAGILGWDMPVWRGADRPVLGPVETAQRILGDDGLPVRGAAPLFSDEASGADYDNFLTPLCDWLEQTDGPREILALGPLTNLAILALVRPDLLSGSTDLSGWVARWGVAITRPRPSSMPLPTPRRSGFCWIAALPPK